jgi:hypothetical protein
LGVNQIIETFISLYRREQPASTNSWPGLNANDYTGYNVNLVINNTVGTIDCYLYTDDNSTHTLTNTLYIQFIKGRNGITARYIDTKAQLESILRDGKAHLDVLNIKVSNVEGENSTMGLNNVLGITRTVFRQVVDVPIKSSNIKFVLNN